MKVSIRRTAALFMLATLPLGGLTACGGDDTSSAPTAPAPTSATQSTTSPPAYSLKMGDTVIEKKSGTGFKTIIDTNFVPLGNDALFYSDENGEHIYHLDTGRVQDVTLPGGRHYTANQVISLSDSAVMLIPERVVGDKFNLSIVEVKADGSATRAVEVAKGVSEEVANKFVFGGISAEGDIFTYHYNNETYITDLKMNRKLSEIGKLAGPYLIYTDSSDGEGGHKVIADARTGKTVRMTPDGEYVYLGNGYAHFEASDSVEDGDIVELKTGRVVSKGIKLPGGDIDWNITAGNYLVMWGYDRLEGSLFKTVDLTTGELLYSKRDKSNKLVLIGAYDDRSFLYMDVAGDKSITRIHAKTGEEMNVNRSVVSSYSGNVNWLNTSERGYFPQVVEYQEDDVIYIKYIGEPRSS